MAPSYKYQVMVLNDYPPDIWTPEIVDRLQKYLDACSRYWKQMLDVDVTLKANCNEYTVFPRSLVNPPVDYTTMDTLDWFGKTVKKYGWNGIAMISRHKAYYHIEQPEAQRSGMSWPPGYWYHILFNMPFIPSGPAFYNNLIPLSHELLHGVVWEEYSRVGTPFETTALDRPPMRRYDPVNKINEYVTVNFEDNYPMQVLIIP